ncbi:hypothetical protein [Paracoccus sp. MKU1]|uniref:hypothetical protein n=1 Tax=Paracoccus sp. MKU1 TaxID=1745182 RepID=UPI00071907BB|nr:hypothetical protein [Paracoccus sp. MKU1]KRW94319.1 hypothetical protein AQY21_20535 [Paracoccus sp. MKU1]
MNRYVREKKDHAAGTVTVEAVNNGEVIWSKVVGIGFMDEKLAALCDARQALRNLRVGGADDGAAAA